MATVLGNLHHGRDLDKGVCAESICTNLYCGSALRGSEQIRQPDAWSSGDVILRT